MISRQRSPGSPLFQEPAVGIHDPEHAVIVFQAAFRGRQADEQAGKIAVGFGFALERVVPVQKQVDGVVSVVSKASGRPRPMASISSAVRPWRTPPGTAQGGWTLWLPSIRMMSWPNWRRRMPFRASSGWASMSPVTLRPAGSLSMPRRRSGALRKKKLRAWLWTYWAWLMSRRSVSAAGGIRTPMIASQALAEASMWLTGQMPQIRMVMPGISG